MFPGSPSNDKVNCRFRVIPGIPLNELSPSPAVDGWQTMNSWKVILPSTACILNKLTPYVSPTLAQFWANVADAGPKLSQSCEDLYGFTSLSSRALDELSLWDSRSLLSYSIAIAGFQPLQVQIDQELVRVVATRSCYGGRTTLKSRFTHILKRYHYVILLKHSTL